MGIIYSEKGNLVLAPYRHIQNKELFKPSPNYANGDLSTEATFENLYGICETLMELFVRPMGMQLSDWGYGYPTLDVVKKHRDGTLPYKRSKKNLTRGWCYLLSGALHRFFYADYDLYKVVCPLDKSGKDYHWWLQSKCGQHVIDLTQEQYLLRGITDVRKDGKKIGAMRGSYGIKTRNIAYVVANHLAPESVDVERIQVTGYAKQYPDLVKTIESKYEDAAMNEKTHARVKEVKFHWDHTIDKTYQDSYLINEVSKYWKDTFIKFDPNKSLEIPKKFIEDNSNKLLKKDNHFFIEKLILESNQTKKVKIEDYFFETIYLKVGNDTQKRVLNQRITVYNKDRKEGSRVVDFNKMGSHYMEMNETFEQIVELQQKFIDQCAAFNDMFKEMQLKNLKSVTQQTKDLYKNQQFKDFNFGNLNNPPWESKGHIDPEKGSVGAIEEWEKESFDNRKAMDDALDEVSKSVSGSYEIKIWPTSMIEKTNDSFGTKNPWDKPMDIDWKSHFEEYKGKGFMSCLDQFLDDPEEENEEDVA